MGCHSQVLSKCLSALAAARRLHKLCENNCKGGKSGVCVIIFDGMGRDIWFSCWSDHEKTIFGAIEEAIYLLNRNDLSKSKWVEEHCKSAGPAVL